MDERSERVRVPARLGAVLVTVALLVAGCSSSGGEASDGASPTTTADAPTTTVADDGSAEEAPDPASPEGETEPPVTLEVEVADTAPAGARRTAVLAPADGPVRLHGTTRPGWHTIDRSPSPPKAGTSRTYPGGTRQEQRDYDADCGDLCGMSTIGRDGSVDTEYGNGDRTHLGPGGDYSETPADPEQNPLPSGGTYDEYFDGGGHVHLGPGGDYYEDPGGTRHYYDGDDGGVDLPPPTYGPPTPPGKAPSGGTGEPHYLTEDGGSVTSQVLGEFVLSTGVDGQEVQARTEAWKRSPTAAAITALAFAVDDQTVQVRVDGSVLVDGEPAEAGTAVEFGFDEGGAAGVWRAEDDGPATTVVVVWPDLSAVWVTPHDGWLDLRIQWREATGEREGVLGTDDGDVENDLVGRDGGDPADPEDQDAVDELVRSWQLTDADTLFTYEDGLSTADYVNPDFPADGPAPDLDDGAERCAEVPEGFARDACTYDVGLTGVDEWVEPAVDLGNRLAADAALRAAVDDITAAIEALGTRGEDPGDEGDGPRLGEGITLSDDDKAGATETGPDEVIGADLDGDSSATYRFTVDEASTIGAFAVDLSCPNEPWEAGQAGYAFFAEDGMLVSGPRLACDDDPDNAEVPAGTYYVKLVGPGAVDVNLEVLPAG